MPSILARVEDLSAVLAERVIGYIEVETLDQGERVSRHGGGPTSATSM